MPHPFAPSPVLLVLLAGLLLALPHTAAGQADFQATLDKVRGDVTRRVPEGDWQQAAPRDRLLSGHRVRTGESSFTLIRFSDETRLVVRDNSEAVITGEVDQQTLRERDVQVDRGNVAFNVKKQEAEQFRFTSPTSVASVRGTIGAWIVAPDGTSELHIFEGSGTLTNTATGESLDVNEGQVGVSDAQGNLSIRGESTLARRDFSEALELLLDFFSPVVYVGVLAGVTTYGGDRDLNPSNDVSTFYDDLGFGFGLEGGYQFTRHIGAGMLVLIGNYPRIDTPIEGAGYPPLDPETTSAWRFQFLPSATYRVSFKGVSVYGQAGTSITFGKINDEIRTSFGPVFGLGFESDLPGGVTLFFEYSNVVVLNDETLDLADPGGPGDVTDTDSIAFFGLGLRKKFKLLSRLK